MRVKGRIYSADLDEDTLIIKFEKDFWKNNRIRAGEVIIKTEDILPNPPSREERGK